MQKKKPGQKSIRNGLRNNSSVLNTAEF